MERKGFLKLGLGGLLGVSTLKLAKASENSPSSFSNIIEKNVGFNHLPNKEIKTMKSIIHKAKTRGIANHGWLDSKHSFSFANYYNPERMNFGALRVLNDDTIAAGTGFGTHPHDNMEIISIPLEGALLHQDSMGNAQTINDDEIQVMSAGTGIRHSEYNASKIAQAKFLQIWVIPNKRNVSPRYDQIKLEKEKMKNKFYQILSPNSDDEGVWIHQNAWFHLAEIDANKKLAYQVKDKKNGVYIFVLNGKLKIENNDLEDRDGMGIWDVSTVNFEAVNNTKVLLMEVPMI
jgi:quercetin 2,3-dioxygenase